ncbi:MAG: hypothetical protein H6Q67_1339 [Firmicutes bacterium]|nr:hypothetical protein [Bacillota bacterium]
MVTRYKLLVFSLLFAILFSQYGYCSGRYYQLYSNSYGTFSLDTFTLEVNSNTTGIYFNAWIMIQYTEEGRYQVIADRLKLGLPVFGYQNLKSSLWNYTFATNGTRNFFKNMQCIEYDTYDNILWNYTYPSSKPFQEAIPGSTVESDIYGISLYCSSNGIQPK